MITMVTRVIRTRVTRVIRTRVTRARFMSKGVTRVRARRAESQGS